MFSRTRDLAASQPADRRFRLAIEDLPNAVVIAGGTGGVLAANRAAESLFGYEPGQLVGQPVERLIPGWSARTKAEPARRPPASGVRSDGEVVPLDIDIEPMADGPVRYVVTYVGVAGDGTPSLAGTVETGAGAAIQRVIADMATRFITVELSALDDSIGESLSELARAFRLDRAILWRQAEADSTSGPSDYAIGYPESSHHELLLEMSSIKLVASTIDSTEVSSFTRLEEVEDQADRNAFLRLGLRSAAVVPLASTAGVARSVLFFGSTTQRDWTPSLVEPLRLSAAVIGQALARKANQTALRGALDDLQNLQESLSADNETGADVRVLRESRMRAGLPPDNMCRRRELEDSPDPSIIGKSAAIRQVLAQLKQVSATDSTVLLLGETGTGKELLATHLHGHSARRGRAMVRVNCAAIPATLMESELFGRERGAFTGALAREIGRFELAHRSTIFLDEIGDLPADLQIKLLRVLEERQIERLGSSKVIDVDVRIITATHRNLEQRIREDAFREDLFYRLNVFPIQVPALRDRIEDIPLLVWRFVDEFSKAFGKQIDGIPRENMLTLQQYSWPGNIRELRNVVERAMIVATGNQLTIDLPTASGSAKKSSSARLQDVEKDHIRGVLESTMWRIRGQGGAAERLGLRPTTLESRMAKLGLSRPKP
jgi:formate hydrogenlyase transcriptional activator